MIVEKNENGIVFSKFHKQDLQEILKVLEENNISGFSMEDLEESYSDYHWGHKSNIYKESGWNLYHGSGDFNPLVFHFIYDTEGKSYCC